MAERISIRLGDDTTLGSLRAVAESLGQRLQISFASSAESASQGKPRRGRPLAVAAPEGPQRRRPLSPAVRAALIRNLAKARAVRSANAKAARIAKAKAARSS